MSNYTKVTTIDELNIVLDSSEFPIDFKVVFSGGIHTTKSILKLENGTYNILNGIDDTEDFFTAEDLFDSTKTVIGNAMKKGCFFAEGTYDFEHKE